MNWILMSTLSRVLVVATGVVAVAAIVLLALGIPNPYVLFAAIALVIVTLVMHRRDMNRAIVTQLQREAEEAAAARRPPQE
jgi:hypothetical protein